MPNPYQVGIGSSVVIWLNVIILAFFWRAAAIRLTASNNPKLAALGAAMGSSL